MTFIARSRGYLLGMNRDEQRTRVPGLPPQPAPPHAPATLHPSEPGGGTWIGINSRGITCALINWYSVNARAPGHAVSRGTVITTLLPALRDPAAIAGLESLPLDRINPFRLIGVFPEQRLVMEWRWDRVTLERRAHPWRPNTWISSGYDEAGANRTRGEAFSLALNHRDAGTVRWLRRLHRSHRPGCGPYSHCMHRPDAATVSYTEVQVNRDQLRMNHLSGHPCAGGDLVARQLQSLPGRHV